MKHIGLFEGIGGFSLAARWMGWQTVAYCEINPICRTVLNYHFPDAEPFNDIITSDFSKYKNAVQIVTGGFPCQPYSLAGKRKGTEDERHLWPSMLKAIRTIQPNWIVAENVGGLVSWNGGLVFNEVQTDLETEGYEVQPFILPACAKDAPHRRDRLWIVAYRNHGQCEQPKEQIQARRDAVNHVFNNTANAYGTIATNNIGANKSTTGNIQREKEGDVFGELLSTGNATDTASRGKGKFRNGNNQERPKGSNKTQLTGSSTDASNTSKQQSQRSKLSRSTEEKRQIKNKSGQFSVSVCGNWEQFPTQSPICGGDDGLPTRLDGITFSKWRNESIKAYGNAIVPQVALEIYKAIEAMIKLGY